MGKPNPFADYPPHFTRAFAAAFGLTALAVGYTYVNNWQDVVAGALLFRAMGNNLGVVLMLLMAGALFGRIRLVNVPVILYGFVTIGFSLMLLLGWDTLEAKMAKDSTGIIGLAALILTVPFPFLAWAFLDQRPPAAYALLGGVLGVTSGIGFAVPVLAIIGAGLVVSYALLASQNRRAPREKVLPSSTPGAGTNGEDLKRHPAQRARFTFADVDGMADLKRTLLEAANEAVSKKPGARNGILLYGPPGNGKSFIAEALAGELGVGIIHVSFGSLASRWVNQSTEQMVALFADAAKQGKVVLFLDEIDALLIDREKVGNADSESARTVSVFLAEVDKLRRHPVILIGATNHLDRLDSAAIREGRFDIKVEMPPPDLDARLGIFERGLLKAHRISLSDPTRQMARDVMARMDGFSVSRIRALTDEFSRMTKATGVKPTYPALLQCLRTIQGKSSSEQERFAPISDLVLASHTAERLRTLVSLMANPMETEKLGGKVPRGVLLYGPPGTGKTTLAKAIAKESGWTFIQTTGHKLLRDPDEVRSVLDRARDLKPAIIFVDEADDVLSERSYSGNAALTNELLTAMDGNSYGLTDVMFIGATNHPDALDSAAVRGGRLGFHVEVGLPGPEESRRIVQGWFARRGLAPESEGFDVDGFVLAKEGSSPADLMHHLEEWANQRAARIMQGSR